MKLADFPQIQALTDDEKEELVDEILLSISQKTDDEDLSPEVKEQLDSRWERYLANPESALTVEQFKEKLDARRRA
jgi:putative addiction module component (TIGR02574 family)